MKGTVQEIGHTVRIFGFCTTGNMHENRGRKVQLSYQSVLYRFRTVRFTCKEIEGSFCGVFWVVLARFLRWPYNI